MVRRLVRSRGLRGMWFFCLFSVLKFLLFKQNKEIKLFITGLLLGMEEGQFVTYLTGFLCDEW